MNRQLILYKCYGALHLCSVRATDELQISRGAAALSVVFTDKTNSQIPP
jgi:hypothetical protein